MDLSIASRLPPHRSQQFIIIHIVASELKDPIWHSLEWQIGSFSSEATIYNPLEAQKHIVIAHAKKRNRIKPLSESTPETLTIWHRLLKRITNSLVSAIIRVGVIISHRVAFKTGSPLPRWRIWSRCQHYWRMRGLGGGGKPYTLLVITFVTVTH